MPRRIHQKGKESYGNVVSEMSFFEKFGSKSEEEGEAHLDISSPKTDSTSDPFMTPPGKPKGTLKTKVFKYFMIGLFVHWKHCID